MKNVIMEKDTRNVSNHAGIVVNSIKSVSQNVGENINTVMQLMEHAIVAIKGTISKVSEMHGIGARSASHRLQK